MVRTRSGIRVRLISQKKNIKDGDEVDLVLGKVGEDGNQLVSTKESQYNVSYGQQLQYMWVGTKDLK